MGKISLERIPHMLYYLGRHVGVRWYTVLAHMSAYWWDVQLGTGCRFVGRSRFKKFPASHIIVGSDCRFNSSSTSNWIGVNRPCMISTLKKDATLTIGKGCGFSGTVIACASSITLGANVRCGANTLITDTDWHSDDPRTTSDEPVEIGDNVWLGVNVTILKGVTIGQGTLVGAGSLVTKSLPANVLAAGVPTRVIRVISA